MDIGEKLFHWSWQLTKKIKAKKDSLTAAKLEDFKDPLTFLSCAFFERTIFLKEAEGVGGLVGDSLFLPRIIDFFDNIEDNYLFYKYKVLYSQIAVELDMVIKDSDLPKEDHEIKSNLDSDIIIEKLKEEYPNLSSFIDKILAKEKLSKVKVVVPLSVCLLPIKAQVLHIKTDKESSIHEQKDDKISTFKKSKSKERVKFVELDEEEPDCNPVSLLMESVNTADIFSGGRKMIDGSDELDDHFAALDELDMRELTRSSKQTKSIFNADISVQIKDDRAEGTEDNFEGQYSYDEWNANRSQYKREWCSVFESKQQAKVVSELDVDDPLAGYKENIKKFSKEIKLLKQYLRSLLLDRKAQNRQSDGPEIDLDALVQRDIDLRCGHSGSDNVFISKRKDVSELAICTLIDASLSADSYVNGRKVLDITKESVTIFQEVVNSVFKHSMVASFFSNTRKNCNYNIIKGFNDSWKSSYHRLEDINASGYTRIGSALRHSLFKLEGINSRRKVIILFSDGKPTDYDAYEGEYGIEDVRQCVREGRAQGIDIISIAIDKEAKFYFPRLFGPQNYEILERPEDVSKKLIKLLSKLTK